MTENTSPSSGSPAEMSPSTLSPVSHGLGRVPSLASAERGLWVKPRSLLSLLFCLFVMPFRPAAGHLQRTGLLVLHRLLRAEPAGGGDLPRLAALSDGGRLHRPLQL